VLKALEKEKPITIGLLQALSVSLYCGLVALFFSFMTKTAPRPGFFGFFVMLVIFVFSAAITGSLVFGYPAYLVLAKNKIKEASTILAYTLGFSLIIVIASVLLIFSLF